MRMFIVGFTVLFLVFSQALADENTQNIILGEAPPKELRITVYNDNLAAIRETYTVELQKGVSFVQFTNVSAEIKPETALLQAGEAIIIEQNFDYDLLTPEKIFEKSVGQNIRLEITNPSTGEISFETAEVLSANQGVILDFGDRIEILREGGLPEQMQFADFPPTLKPRPTLTMTLTNESLFEGDLAFTYLTEGMEWEAQYVFNLSPDETTADIQAWVKLTNKTGTNFENVILKLLAGDIHRAREPQIFYESDDGMVEQAVVTGSRIPESLGDYHLYTLSEKTSLLNNQQKKLALFDIANIPIEKTYWIYLETPEYLDNDDIEIESVVVSYEFLNSKDNGVGTPFPKGKVTLYIKDSQGQNQYLNEDWIRNTPENDEVSLSIGSVFDLTATQRVVSVKDNRRKLPGAAEVDDTEIYKVEVTINNATNTEKEIDVFSQIVGYRFYDFLETNFPQEIDEKGVPFWKIMVPGKGQTVLTYTAEIPY